MIDNYKDEGLAATMATLVTLAQCHYKHIYMESINAKTLDTLR